MVSAAPSQVLEHGPWEAVRETLSASLRAVRKHVSAKDCFIVGSLVALGVGFWREKIKRNGERNCDKYPRMLILIRHGESEGNRAREAFSHVPDNALHLTEMGWRQSVCAGKRMRELIDEKIPGKKDIVFTVSPYIRALETFHGLVESFGGMDKVQWSEDPRIREQDFGNFENFGQQRARHKEKKKFGVFFYRFHEGESPADVYDRVSGFIDSIQNLWNRYRGKMDRRVDILVTHGITVQVFLMRFFDYTIDMFHYYENFNNCEFAVIEADPKHDGMRLTGTIDAWNQNENLFHRQRRAPTSAERSLRIPLDCRYGPVSDMKVKFFSEYSNLSRKLLPITEYRAGVPRPWFGLGADTAYMLVEQTIAQMEEAGGPLATLSPKSTSSPISGSFFQKVSSCDEKVSPPSDGGNLGRQTLPPPYESSDSSPGHFQHLEDREPHQWNRRKTFQEPAPLRLNCNFSMQHLSTSQSQRSTVLSFAHNRLHFLEAAVPDYDTEITFRSTKS